MKKIIELANVEATRRGSPEVGPGHLLLAMAGEEMRPLAGPLLEGLGVAPDEVRRSAENSVCVESSQAAGEQNLESAGLRYEAAIRHFEAKRSGRVPLKTFKGRGVQPGVDLDDGSSLLDLTDQNSGPS